MSKKGSKKVQGTYDIYMYQWEGVTVCNQTLRWQRQRPNQYHCFWKAVFEETFIFLQNPTPTPSPCGWEYMRIFFLPNCSALVWNYKFGLRETFWPSLTQRRILNAKIAQLDAADGQFLPFQIAQLVWNYKFGLGETLHPSLTSTFSLSRPAWNTDSLPILYCNVNPPPHPNS